VERVQNSLPQVQRTCDGPYWGWISAFISYTSLVAELADYERRFRRAGLPLFIEDYSAREDVWTRAAPFFVFVFIGEMLGAIDLDWPILANVGAALGGLAILLGAFGLINLLRKRPFWSLPEDVGPLELAGFVLLPAALPLIFGGQWGSAALTAAANLVLLALAFGLIRYGLFAIVRWSGAGLFEQLAASVSVISRAVPLLLVFALVLFINTEMWQVFSRMPDAFLALAGGLFVLAGSVFVVTRLPREVRELEEGAGAAGPPLESRQRFNVGLVMFVSQALQILVVSVAIGAFFVIFGALAVGPELRDAWEVERQGVVLRLTLFGESLQVTEALLRVSGGIAAFSGLYYAIAVLTDSTYRQEFRDELTEEMADSFAARAEYLQLRSAGS
jgi:hypothetical protein